MSLPLELVIPWIDLTQKGQAHLVVSISKFVQIMDKANSALT